MRRTFAPLLASLALLAGPLHAAPDAQQLLAASDTIRNPDKPFGLTTTLTEYRNGKQVDSSALAIYSRADDKSGQFRSLLRFVAPARDAGKLMLKNGNELWFHDPASKGTIRISPQQRLLGQAANGDVVTVNLSLDYRAAYGGEESIQDGEKQTRTSQKLNLTAKNPEVTYHRIELWLDAGNQRPLKAKFYSESDRLLKTAYYRKYQNELGRERPTETVIIDGLDPNWVTVMRFSDYAWKDVPESWLQRDYLPRFKPEN
ncbi:outer membrane lipoprotein-sorting protein [Chitinilyticum aquatile]|uniref:outer membrane lipoprotein-sorting protein n=1 Tax=Chitinilyticum aquatile TaxID=362520 RepID=UPI000422DBCA|nr:outer membrane lipoprotein-sorting protein [Chitinilyticum aquatile]